jgi:hypothetical protein
LQYTFLTFFFVIVWTLLLHDDPFVVVGFDGSMSSCPVSNSIATDRTELQVAQGSKMRGATRIIGIDLNPDKFDTGNTNRSTVLKIS